MFLNFVRYLYIRFQLFMTRTEGASAIEYALIVAMVAVFLVGFAAPIGVRLKLNFNNVLVALGGTAIP